MPPCLGGGFRPQGRTLGMSRARKLKRSVSWRASASMPWLDLAFACGCLSCSIPFCHRDAVALRRAGATRHIASPVGTLTFRQASLTSHVASVTPDA
jgi:hypothetical protein